jgi:hypothetical protein
MKSSLEVALRQVTAINRTGDGMITIIMEGVMTTTAVVGAMTIATIIVRMNSQAMQGSKIESMSTYEITSSTAVRRAAWQARTYATT